LNTYTKLREGKVKTFAIVMCLMLTIAVVQPALSGDVKLDPYGYVRAEGYYDTESVAAGDWLLLVANDKTAGRDIGQLGMSARHTRVGIKLSGIEIKDGMDVFGKIEIDFAGGFPNSGTAARQPLLRLRLAYIGIKSGNWEYRFGQDWAIISAPFPNTANFVVGAAAGNLWMRMQQASLSYKTGAMKLTGSVNRGISGNNKYSAFTSSDLDANGDGEKTGLPFVMGRLDYNKKAVGISVFGHTGWEDIADLSGKINRVTSWSGAVAVRIEGGKMRLRAKVFQGENLNSFFGGIIQGHVALANTVENVAAMGGWVDLTVKLNSKWSTALGAGMDDPDDEFLTPLASRDLNEFIWGNIQFSPVKNLKFMFETNYMRTTYVEDAAGNQPAGDNIRFAFVSVLTF
jgi:hypothetical protein